jgi:hypothetical protein
MAARDPALHRALLPHIGAIVVVIVASVRDPLHRPQPARMFDYIEGVIRWHNRVVGYAFILFTDQYPPFRLWA